MTRMWNIPPEYLCRYHFLGEHNELHKIVGSLNAGRSVQGYLDKGQIEVHNIRARHEELVQEFENRGWNHKSPLPEFRVYKAGKIDIKKSLEDLINRCPKCKERILKGSKIQ